MVPNLDNGDDTDAVGDAYDASLPSVSLVDLGDRDFHLQNRELALLFVRGAAAGCLSAQ